MSFFRRNRGDVIDFVELQKRGLLEAARAVEADSRIPMSKEGIVDFSALANANSSSGGSVGSNSGGGFLGFLDSPSSSSDSSFSNSMSNTNSNRGDEISHLKVKIEDLEFKLDRLMEKLARIESLK